ncbi:MAG: type IV pilus secretin PilQ [Acidobacteria bacterium]|nr:type IV pilus secretin PilQ [Acidobacteriota bacterium]
MKMRHAPITDSISTKAKGATCGILLLLLALSLPGLARAGENSGAPARELVAAAALTDVRFVPENDRAVITVDADRQIAPEQFMLDNPRRLVLDFPNTRNRIPFTRLPIRTASVKKLRVQQYQTSPSLITRMVFDLEEGHGTHELSVDSGSVRLVFHPGQNSAAPEKTAGAAAGRREYVIKPYSPPEQPAASEPAVASAIKPAAARPAAATAIKPAAVQPAAARPAAARPAAAPTVRPAPAPPAAAPPAAATAIKPAAVQPAAPPAPEAGRPEAPPLIAALAQSAVPGGGNGNSNGSRFSGHPLTLDLVNVPLVDFFRLMADEGGINIVLDPAVKGTLSMKVVKMPWDQIFEAALRNNSLDKQIEGTMVRVARKSTLQEEARQQEALKKANLLAADLQTRIKRLNYAKAKDLVDAVSDQKTVRGTVVVDERTNSLILTDIPASIARQIDLIEALDLPQAQVEIEARIVSASRNFARDIGVQFGFVQGNLERVTVGGPNTFGTIGGTRPSATPDKTYAAGNPITGRGAGITGDDGGTASESAAVSTGTQATNKGNYNVNLPAARAFGGLGISVGNIFDTFLLDAAITAGETKGMAKLISQPKVIAQNNSRAVVTQGLRFPVPINSNNTVTIQFFDAALTLTATPQITYEGNIVLDLKVENNTADFGNSVDGVPSIRTSESSTRVLVTDGGTTVIGGILLDEDANSENKVPGLGSLPVIGHLFKNTSVTRSTQEILFFVTPRIVK